MASKTRSRFIDEPIASYAAQHSSPPDQVQLDLQEITAQRTGGFAGMQIGDDQAVLMEIIVRAMGARSAIEIGTFTGYSALAVARGLGPSGRLLCLDVSEEWTSIGRPFWERAGVADRIEVRIGPALDTLRALPTDAPFDFAFVDADKSNYSAYYEELLPRLRPGGLLLADNTLWSGAVLDTTDRSDDTLAIRALNDAVAADGRVRAVLLPIGDGVTVIQKL
ncbi:MAG: O-methyltransferase [Acidimicrobiales bacterium]